MIIRRITLTNFRRFDQLDLDDLPVGLIGIIGENGSGKSTILEAVGWALYGTYALTGRTEKEGVKTQGADADENCEVTLEFEMADASYKIVRRLHGKRAIAQAFVYKNGEEQAVAEREEGVNAYVSKLFGMDRATFFASVFARQKELDLLTSQNPSERKKIIRRLLRIDLIDSAIKEIRQDNRQKKQLADNLKDMLIDVNVVKAEIKELIKKKDLISLQREADEKIFNNIKTELTSARAVKQEMESKRKAFQRIHSSLISIEQEIKNKSEQMEKRKGELKELQIEKKELIKIEPKEAVYVSVRKEMEKLESLRGLYEEKKNLKKDLTERQNDHSKILQGKQRLVNSLSGFKGLSEKKKKLEIELKNKIKDLNRVTKDINTLAAKKEACIGSIALLEKKKINIKKLGPQSKCPECAQDLGANYTHILDHFDKEIVQQQQAISDLDVKSKEQNTKSTSLEKQIENFESKLEKLREDEKDESGLKSNLETEEKRLVALTLSIKLKRARMDKIGHLHFSETKYEELKKQNKDLQIFHEQIMELRTKTARIPSLTKEINVFEKRVFDLNNEKTLKEKEQKSVGYSEKDRDAADKHYQDLYEKAHEQELAIKDLKHQIDTIKKDIAHNEAELKRQKETRRKWKKADSDAKKLSVLDDLLDRFRQDLASRIRPMLIARTSQLVGGTTGGRYAAVDLDEDYNVYVYDGTESFPVKRFSGGEQDLVNLCLRIAISQVISEQNSSTGINFIALDEIFGSQDAGRKESILKALNNISGQFRQIFLITHHENLKDEMQHVLIVEEVEEGMSKAVFVSS
ncbi:AAA family ATPase [Acidobacteriota bacterium]